MIMDWARMLAYITGTVDQELLLRNEYLAAENRILKAQLKTPLRLTDTERVTLAEIAHHLGRKALEDVANAAKPDTITGWYRRLVARKFDGSKSRQYPGRSRIDDEMEQLGVFSIIAGISSMTVTPNTVSHFGRSSNPVISKRFRSLHAVRI